jgi:hypothetical protein
MQINGESALNSTVRGSSDVRFETILLALQTIRAAFSKAFPSPANNSSLARMLICLVRLKYHRQFRPDLERGNKSEGNGSKHDSLCHFRILRKQFPSPIDLLLQALCLSGLAVLIGNI